MKTNLRSMALAAFVFSLVIGANTLVAQAQEDVNIPITANQAFDAVVKQVDPTTGAAARVALIDLRTTAEYFWVGACAKVESIIKASGEELIPKNGKVKMKRGNFLFFRVETPSGPEPVILHVSMVETVNTTDISIHIPTHIWDEANSSIYANPDFAATIESLHADFDVLILTCRSGKRSNTRDFDTSLFDVVYEIDDPNGKDGRGGVQGTSYGDVYNGYRGYPGRRTKKQDAASVSWSDTGLPVHIGWTPHTPDPSASEDE